MKIFSGPESLGVTEEQINCKTGTLGIPEFGTKFKTDVRRDETDDILRVSPNFWIITWYGRMAW